MVILVTPGAKYKIVEANIKDKLKDADIDNIYVFCYD